ncbi:RNA binding protein [Leptomonas seymouri]|uniref:RNA binding protein n=1 Tax=Leptomonas seymouri TaxID=5684 RepID=A0A0N1I1I4_LEPSE|nr:RNA binding protein [Leptomonas seymouri]|eukprot:KPI90052.1 RNA binding protein [Leptomonas seymouri]
MNVMSPPFYGKGYSAQNSLLLWEATQVLQDGMRDQSNDLRRLLDIASSLQGVMESTRDMYNTVIKERDDAHRRLKEADSKLQQVEHVVRRYAEVKDPVVASDGYTYERTELSRYLSDCKKSNSKAYSQQTKEELTEIMVDNVSLRRLAELLKGVHTVEVPQLSNRVPLANGGGGNDGQRMRSRWMDEDSPMGGVAHADMGTGAPGPIAGAGGRPGNGMPMNAGHGGRRFDHAGKFNKSNANNEGKGNLHPCIRVYGFCNFDDDCTFANYPFEACLNHIKGKCRFGSTCKELHVDPRDPAYQNQRSYANHQHHHGAGNNNTNSSNANNPSAAAETKDSKMAAQAESSAPKPAESVERTAAEDAAAVEKAAKKVESNSKKEGTAAASPATTDKTKSDE